MKIPFFSSFLEVKLKKRPADPFYNDINLEDLSKYQRYLNEMFVATEADKMPSENDNEKDPILVDIATRASKDSLHPFYLLAMFVQYVYADMPYKIMARSYWVHMVVLNINPHGVPPAMDFWPPGWKAGKLVKDVFYA